MGIRNSCNIREIKINKALKENGGKFKGFNSINLKRIQR